MKDSLQVALFLVFIVCLLSFAGRMVKPGVYTGGGCTLTITERGEQ